MARFKKNFTYYYRDSVMPDIIVWYYRVYTPAGIRVAKSTGLSSKKDPTQKHQKVPARVIAYCENLYKHDLLYQGDNARFSCYAEHFFDFGSDWYEARMQGSTPEQPGVSKSYVKMNQHLTKRFLVPFFGKYHLYDLCPDLTFKFRSWMIKKGLSNKTINLCCDAFHIITQNAMTNGLMLIDPMASIKALPTNKKARNAFLIDDVQKMLSNGRFSQDTSLFILIAAVTGMRFSELLAIRKETVLANCIDVHDQYIYKELSPVKAGSMRKVPIDPILYHKIIENFAPSGKLFPLSPTHYRRDFNDGNPISKEEREKRHLTIHSFRHFYNTYLLAKNVPPAKVDGVIGHSDGKGTVRFIYTNWEPDMFPEVYKAQHELLQLLYVIPQEK